MEVTRHVLKREDDAAADAAAQAEFNEKKWVWVPDDAEGYLPGWITKETKISTSSSVERKTISSGTDGDYVTRDKRDVTVEDVIAEVVLSNGQIRNMSTYLLSKMNPPKFDRVDDIADLTFLNEASVVHNLRLRFGAGSIYTYSGLFLISLNPYTALPIYTPQIVASYRNKRREECAPHIFATAERAWVQMGEERESQSILITGESGAGKTENTKKVIQYLAAIASRSASVAITPSRRQGNPSQTDPGTPSKGAVPPRFGLPRDLSFRGKSELDLARQKELGLLEKQILQANPILEAFGNAQTMRNNNSSRFGKFIRIMFDGSGAISGADIDWYLLEKSRVTARADKERNFHVFYQLLASGRRGADIRKDLLLGEKAEDYGYLKRGRTTISGVDDSLEWRVLQSAFTTVGFTDEEQLDILRVVAAILHIGNVQVEGDKHGGQARISDLTHLEKVAHLLGASVTDLQRAILRPTAKAGREIVQQARSKEQADDELASLCKTLYERTFGSIVERINKALDQQDSQALFVGVLDIAGFEIFDVNGYEQLLINYTNERLQQFFNYHMFTLEQEEYSREGIQWEFVNFGLDLQPTIDLIESAQPIGILATLDEECIMPKASDTTFLHKLVSNVTSATQEGRFRQTKFGKGFLVKHYAGAVEYDTADWLKKNKDPLNENISTIMSATSRSFVAALFPDESVRSGPAKMVKRGAFRTVAQRHKEQLFALVTQLQVTQPHFVRCIVPNPDKKPGRVDTPMVLHQLRCNGVLEGIRIARLGYPNRLAFAEFRHRYEVLTPDIIPKGYIDGRKACVKMVEALRLTSDAHKLGTTKIFFKAGVLAILEEKRDAHLYDIFARMQSVARKHMARRKLKKLLNRTEAIKTIQRNAEHYSEFRDWPWWQLYVQMRPLVEAKRNDQAVSKEAAAVVLAKQKADLEKEERERTAAIQAKHEEDLRKMAEGLASERRLVEARELQLAQHKISEHDLHEEVQRLNMERQAAQLESEQAKKDAEALKGELNETRHELAGRLQDALTRSQDDGMWQRKASELSEKLLNATQALAASQEVQETVEKELASAKAKVSRIEQDMQKIRREAETVVVDHAKALQTETDKRTAVERDMATLRRDLAAKAKQSETLSAAASDHDVALKRKEARLAKIQRESADAMSEVKRLLQANADLAGQFTTAQRAAENAARDSKRKTNAADNAQKELDGLRQLMAAKQSEAASRASAEQSMSQELATLRRKSEESEMCKRADAERAATTLRQITADLKAAQAAQAASAKTEAKTSAEAAAASERLDVLRRDLGQMQSLRKGLEAQVAELTNRLVRESADLADSLKASKSATAQQAAAQRKINEFEDVVLTFEREKAEWVHRMETQGADLVTARNQRRDFEGAALAQESIIINLRGQTQKLVAAIKARDDEISLLRSRENKTVIEHVHVLEKAKRVTDRELAQTQEERDRLSTLTKSLDQQKARLQSDLEDMTRQAEMLRSHNERATPPPVQDPQAINQERAARRKAEDKVLQLESAMKRLTKEKDDSLAEQQRLAEQVASMPAQASVPQDRLLRELRHNNERLQQQMSDELNRSVTTPSRPAAQDSPSRTHKRSHQGDDRDSRTHNRTQSANILSTNQFKLNDRAAGATSSPVQLRTDRSASVVTKPGSPTDSQFSHLDKQIEEAQSLYAGFNATSTAAIRNLIAQQIEAERKQYARDLLRWEGTINQTREKYQEELSRLTQELAQGRDDLSKHRQRENAQKSIVEDLRLRLNEEEHNSSGWKREKQRLERRILDLSEAYEASSGKTSEAQAQQVLYISQLKEVKDKLQRTESELDSMRVAKQKAQERAASLLDEELKASVMSRDRVALQLSQRNQELESTIQEMTDGMNLLKEKQTRSDAHASECTQELSKIRALNADIDRRNLLLEKELKNIQVKMVDLETRSYTHSPRTLTRGVGR